MSAPTKAETLLLLGKASLRPRDFGDILPPHEIKIAGLAFEAVLKLVVQAEGMTQTAVDQYKEAVAADPKSNHAVNGTATIAALLDDDAFYAILDRLDLLRPPPEPLHPRFLAAGNALQKLREEFGDEAMHAPENAALFIELHQYAPQSLKDEMTAKAEELGLLPKASMVDVDGKPVFSLIQMADTLGVSVEEVQAIAEKSGIAQQGYTGPVFPLQ